MAYKNQELLTIREHMNSPTGILVGSVLLIALVFLCVVLLCVFTFFVPCCDVRCDLRIKTMLGSSLPLVVYMVVHVLLYVFLSMLAYSDVQYFRFFQMSLSSEFRVVMPGTIST